jgi:hypothetical protein
MTAGTLAFNSLLRFCAIYSGVSPAPPLASLGCIIKTVSAKRLTVATSYAILAFGWRPNTSGSSSYGRVSMYVLVSARDPSGGA